MITNNHLSVSSFSIWSMSHEPLVYGQNSKAGRKKKMLACQEEKNNCRRIPKEIGFFFSRHKELLRVLKPGIFLDVGR